MEDNGLPHLKRYITEHNADGSPVFSSAVADALPWNELPAGYRFALGYASETFPVEMNKNADVAVYQKYLKDAPGIVIPGGTVVRMVDMRPDSVSPMHRTVSLDYGVVLEGEVWLVLESGEERLMKRGDVAIQRGTNHEWRNNSKTEWARMMYVLQEAAPLEVGGKVLGEDLGHMPGVRPSGPAH